MRACRVRVAFTLLELLISLAVICALLVILVPALSTARMSNHRALCAGNQRLLGQAWFAYVDSNGGRFPLILVQPSWMYGGVRFSTVDEGAFLDYDRPLNRYLPVHRLDAPGEALFHCPADRGITDEFGEVGTGSRTAFRAFGTSYRANAELLTPRKHGGRPPEGGLPRDLITTAPSRLVVMGDPFWYETLEQTGRQAAWHGTDRMGNMLFLDGSVRFLPVAPRPKVGAAVFDPLAPGLAFPLGKE